MLEAISGKVFLNEVGWRDMCKGGYRRPLEDVALPICDPRKAVRGEIGMSEIPPLLCKGFPEVIVLIERSVACGAGRSE